MPSDRSVQKVEWRPATTTNPVRHRIMRVEPAHATHFYPHGDGWALASAACACGSSISGRERAVRWWLGEHGGDVGVDLGPEPPDGLR